MGVYGWGLAGPGDGGIGHCPFLLVAFLPTPRAQHVLQPPRPLLLNFQGCSALGPQPSSLPGWVLCPQAAHGPLHHCSPTWPPMRGRS